MVRHIASGRSGSRAPTSTAPAFSTPPRLRVLRESSGEPRQRSADLLAPPPGQPRQQRVHRHPRSS
eukprot:2271549-Alexandrium_andersonii.AAC.1